MPEFWEHVQRWKEDAEAQQKGAGGRKGRR